MTGIGQEIHEGSVQSVFAQSCLPWKNPPLNGTNFCSNPSGSISGPWCYVRKEEKQPCDVPICDFPRNLASNLQFIF